MARTTTADLVSELIAASRSTPSQRGSGTRTLWFGVRGWFGTQKPYARCNTPIGGSLWDLVPNYMQDQ